MLTERVIMINYVNVDYIFHSGYSVRAADKLFLFDYYCDRSRESQKQANSSYVAALINNPSLQEVYIFVSHNHADHFDPGIFAFSNLGSEDIKIRYIFSSDVAIDRVLDNYYFIEPYKTLDFNSVQVKAYGSTDEGVSFLVSCNGLVVFHAGDLNWWYWYYESTPEELAEYESSFKAEIARIESDDIDHIDIAFFPVDPRLKDYSHHGGAYFLDKFKPKYFFPMHFAYGYQETADFSGRYADKFPETSIMKIERERQNFQLRF